MAKQHVIYKVNRDARGENGTHCYTVKNEDDFNKCVKFGGCEYLMTVSNNDQLIGAMVAINKVDKSGDEYTDYTKQL